MPSPTPLATLADVVDVAGAIPVADQPRITGLITKVSAMVRRYTKHSFQIGAVTGAVSTIHPHDGVARLPNWPVRAIGSVVAAGTAVAATNYEFTANGMLKPIQPVWSYNYLASLGATFELDEPYNPTGAPVGDWGWPPVPLVVTYDYGYDAVPDDVALVVAEKVATMYLFGALNVQMHSESIDGYSVQDRYQKPLTTGAWTPEHKMVLDTYRRSGLASVRLT